MVDKIKEVELPKPLSKKEKLEREYRQEIRDKKISRAKAGVMRNQILKAYEILDNIRFDYLSDTAFRDTITTAKKSLESAIDDFLLSDTYWENRIDKFYEMKLDGYKKWKTESLKPRQGKINK